MLLLIPQRYEFSSKSQPLQTASSLLESCCWYHKGTNFQANHNQYPQMGYFNRVVADTTKVRIFKQITTKNGTYASDSGCCWYHKGTNFQANHNFAIKDLCARTVVADTTKVRIFKQITTNSGSLTGGVLLLLIPQRYEFSSKSQRYFNRIFLNSGCCWYHKGTNFQANHNISNIS